MNFMHGQNKKFLILGIIVVLMIVSAEYLYVIYTTNTRPSYSRPAPLQVENAESFQDFLNEAKPIITKNNISIMLPTRLPNGLKPVAVWGLSGGWLIAYSNKNISTSDDALLGITILFLDKHILGPFLYKDPMGFLNKEAEVLRAYGRKVIVSKIDEFYVKAIIGYPRGYSIDAYVYDLNNNIEYHIAIKSSTNISYNDFIEILKSFQPLRVNSSS